MKGLIYIVLFFLGGWLYAQNDVQSVGPLPQTISETSGLIYHNGKLITHNDSGNTPQLFEIDTVSLAVTRTVTIENAINVDWEDLAQDDEYIYIGDFGNNTGDRQDLAILRVAKAAYDRADTVSAERIDFFYEDQEDFMTTQSSDWDAEALFVLNDDLIVLTKQWQSQGTVAYRLPKLPGAFLAERLDDYQVNGLVTGATYDAASSELYLVGYSQFLSPFFEIIEGVTDNTIFSGEKTQTILDIGFAQIEAVEQAGATFYVTSEEFINSSPPISSASRLFRFTLDEDDLPPEEEEEEEEGENPFDGGQPNNDQLVIYKRFDSELLNYRLNTSRAIFGMGIFDTSGRQVQFVPLEELQGDSIDLSTLGPSVYYFTFFLKGKTVSKPYFKF